MEHSDPSHIGGWLHNGILHQNVSASFLLKQTMDTQPGTSGLKQIPQTFLFSITNISWYSRSTKYLLYIYLNIRFLKMTQKSQSQNKAEKVYGRNLLLYCLKYFYVSICSSNPLEFISGKYYILKIPKVNIILTKL